MSGIRRKFLFQLLYVLSQLAFPLITYPYITRTIGPEGLGLIGYIEYVSGFIITIAAFGIPFYGVREIAKFQDDEQKKQYILRGLFPIHLLVSLIGCAVFVILIKANEQQEIPPILLLLGCINILLPAFIADWYMQGIEAFQFTAIRSLVLRLAGLVALFLFVRQQQDVIYYYFIIVAVQAAVAISNMHKIGWRGFVPKLSKDSWLIKSLWHFFLTSSIISVYVFFDVLVLSWMADERQVGYYAIAIRIIKLSLLLVLSLNVILFPRISYLRANSADETQLKELIKKAMQFILLLTIPLFAGFYFLAHQIIYLLAGDAFHSSIALVQIMSILPMVIGFSNLFVYQVLTPFGKEKQLLLCVVITCVFSLLLHFFMARLWLEKGTAWATVLTETIMTLLTAFYAAKAFRIPFPYSAFFQGIVAILPLVALALISQAYLQNPLASILVTGSFGLAVYVAIQFMVFKNTIVLAAWESIKERNRRIANG